jgi:peptidoglycan-associated lipoprotein
MKRPSNVPTTVLAAALVTLSVAVGCGHEDTKPAAVPTITSTTVTQTTLSPASPGKANSTIFLSDSLRKACGITKIEDVKDAPKFDFNKDDILPDDRAVLAQVAQCLTTGPLKGRQVKLVGRADLRGTQEYNMALGERRSNAVLNYLAAMGVSSSQMRETSRGSLDSTGSDEASWRTDRRVDIDVLDATP